MAIVRIQSFNDGSLLRRTIVHVMTMTIGAVAFVALLSFALVTAAKGLLPKHTGEEAEETPTTAEEASEEVVPAVPGKLSKSSRPPRRKGALQTPEVPAPN